MHCKFIFLSVFGEDIRWQNGIEFLAECINFIAQDEVLDSDLFPSILLDKAQSISSDSNDEFGSFVGHVFGQVLDFG
jgi:hypothetical protein